MRAWLQLVRLPAVFTTFADILLGFLLSHPSFADAPGTLTALLVSSVCLYMAGMILNDVFDRDIDAKERPMRPIPSGRITLQKAAGAGGGLMAAGVAFAALAGLQSFLVAAALAAAILAYDGFLKRTPLGPLGMGACRSLNVLLGAGAPLAGGAALAGWPQSQWMPAAALGLYIVGVTLFARNEAGNSTRGSLALATAVVALGLAALIWVGAREMASASPQGAVFILGVVAELLLLQLFIACASPTPERVQGAVKLMLMTYVLLDAALIFSKTGEALPALAVAALLIPATIAGRWLYVT